MDNSTNNSNNNMIRSMFLVAEDPRHFLASAPVLTGAEAEFFQRKLTQTSGPLTAVNNVASVSNIATSVADTIVTSETNHVLQNAVPQAVTTLTHKVNIAQVNHAPKARPHACTECGKAFMLKHHLLTHMRVHSGERPHVCPECGKTFALKHCLSTHMLLHTSERPYKCMECSKTFTLKHHLVSHERSHTRDRPFECPECGRRFPQKRHLTTHIKFHSGERPYSCQICGENFSREEHLVMHSRFHGGQSPYVCSDCGAGFLRKFELVNHERQHGRNPESCLNCGREFLQKRTLLMHVRTCGLQTQSKTAGRFANTNTQLNKTCRECGESFSTSEALALHHRLHVGDHSFLTDICSLAATLKNNVPIASFNNSVSKRLHECPDCGKCFTQKHGLYQHKARHPNATCKLRPFACEKCGKSFAQKNHLSLHERQHMNPPPNQLRRQRQQQAQAATQASQQQMGDTQQSAMQNDQPQTSAMGHISTITVYDVSVSDLKPDVTILGPQSTSQNGETQTEILGHIISTQDMQPRIIQHIQQPQTAAQIVANNIDPF